MRVRVESRWYTRLWVRYLAWTVARLRSLRGLPGVRNALLWDLNQLAIAYMRLGEWQRAILAFKEVSSLYREFGYTKMDGAIQANLGMCYLYADYPGNAAYHLRAALPLLRQQGNVEGVAAALDALVQSLGRIEQQNFSLQSTNEWREYTNELLSIAQRTGNRLWEARGLICRGLIHARCGEREAARVAWTRAIEAAEGCGDRDGVGRAVMLLKWLRETDEAL